MTDRQYSTTLSLLVLPPLVAQIAERMGLDEAAATEKLYHSPFYDKLADERLKLWHYSPVMLADMFVEAERTGTIPYPED